MQTAPWGVYKAHQLFGDKHCERELTQGRWIRAVPLLSLSFMERLRGAIYVLRGLAVAVQPPVDGELEETIIKDNIAHLVSMLNKSQETNVELRKRLHESTKELLYRIELLERGFIAAAKLYTVQEPANDAAAEELRMAISSRLLGADWHDAVNALQLCIQNIRMVHDDK